MAVDLDRVYRDHGPALYRYVANLAGDADLAGDAVQEAFVRLAGQRPAPREVRAWLFRVATRLALEWMRTHTRRVRLLAGAPDGAAMGDAPPAPDELLDRRERHDRVRRALDALAPRDRTVLLMREEGFSHQEIAAAVDTTTKSVGTMVARALAKLAAELELDDPEAP